jgi:hypothetical protein
VREASPNNVSIGQYHLLNRPDDKWRDAQHPQHTELEEMSAVRGRGHRSVWVRDRAVCCTP